MEALRGLGTHGLMQAHLPPLVGFGWDVCVCVCVCVCVFVCLFIWFLLLVLLSIGVCLLIVCRMFPHIQYAYVKAQK